MTHRCVFALPWILIACAAGSAGNSLKTKKIKPEDVKVAAVASGSQKLFVGPEGLSVAQVKLDDGTYLMQIKGSDSPIDGKVLPYKRQELGGGHAVFTTTVDGRDNGVLQIGKRWGVVDYRLYVPLDSLRKNVEVGFDENKSKTVDAPAMVQSYRQMVADGSLRELQRFHRKQREAKQREEIAKEVARLNEACGSKIELRVDWKSIDDETLKTLSIAGYCGAPASALRQMCKSPGVRKMISTQLAQVYCVYGDEARVELSGKTLNWTITKGASNLEQNARKYLAEAAPWPAGQKPAEVTYLESSSICSDGKSLYVGWHPYRKPQEASGDYTKQIFYGDGKSFKRLPRDTYLGNGWFYDPRYFVSTRNANMRGIDYRYHSQFEIDEKQGRCEVTCGERTLALKLLPQHKAAELMASGSFELPKGPRVPYGLARDRRGTYYYVDRGPEKDSRDFKLYKGPLGRLRPLKMTNLVADSEGDVFSTRSGSLRLVLEKPHSFWIKHGKRSKLINVPIRDNLQLIYNELGIYLGQPFNTPCDLL